ncbi:MAG: hypothetical protein K2G03_00990, partial [Bacilli bacterium]|nr:hypothetical protein [Bacilli bacterium]
MKLGDSIKYSFLKTIRDKKNIYFIIIMTLCLFILIASLFFRIVYFALGDNQVEMAKDSRKVYVVSEEISKYFEDKNYDLGYDKLLELEHVVDVYSNKYDFYYITSETFKDDKHSGEIRLAYGSEKSQPKYINGEKIKNEDTGVAICSKRFYPSTTNGSISNDNIQFINGDDLIGTT